MDPRRAKEILEGLEKEKAKEFGKTMPREWYRQREQNAILPKDKKCMRCEKVLLRRTQWAVRLDLGYAVCRSCSLKMTAEEREEFTTDKEIALRGRVCPYCDQFKRNLEDWLNDGECCVDCGRKLYLHSMGLDDGE